MTEIKATAVNPTLEYVMYEHGKDVFREVMMKLSEDQYRMFRKKLLVTAWVPLDDFLDLNRAIVDVLWDGDERMIEVVGRYSADQSFNRFYKILLRFITPDTLMDKASSIFSSMYRPGEQKIEESGKGYCRFSISGMEVKDPVLYYRIKGYAERAAELTGAKNLRTELEIHDNHRVNAYITMRWT